MNSVTSYHCVGRSGDWWRRGGRASNQLDTERQRGLLANVLIFTGCWGWNWISCFGGGKSRSHGTEGLFWCLSSSGRSVGSLKTDLQPAMQSAYSAHCCWLWSSLFESRTKNWNCEIWGSDGDEYKDGCIMWCSALKMEAVDSSETSVNISRTKRCCISEDSHFAWNCDVLARLTVGMLMTT